MTSPRLPLAACAALLVLGTLGAASAATAPDAPRILMERAQAAPQVLLAEGESPSPPPGGPALPTIQDGIGPGSGLHQSPTAGAGGYICTAAFILRDPATAKYYLSTAGHCVVRDAEDTKPYTGAANPDKVDQVIEVCVAQCLDNALGLGTYATFAAKAGYQPVTFGQSNGVGEDFGIIEIPGDRTNLIRPWMPQFGGPTGYDPSSEGDFLVHYGHGSYCCPLAGAVASRSPADQGRIAISLGVDGTSFSGVGSVTGGDSGSGVGIGVLDSARGMVGGAAVGVFTHTATFSGNENLPILYGTTLRHGLDMVRAATGLQLELVLQDDPLQSVPQPASAARITLTNPAAGGTLRPGPDGTATLSGRAGLGNATPPADAIVQVAIDDATFEPSSRVPVVGAATWNATWDLHGVPLGRHVIYARLVGPDGPLASTNATVTVAARTSSSAGGSTQHAGHLDASAGGGTRGATGADAPAAPGKKTPGPGIATLAAGVGLAAWAGAWARARRR
ncbi:MAG TPA: hypothetical protein VM286_01725 [Candidatus Thermoplasmatota archaeon]|nr:hypothetical protein [Candidatus Thermoplasmatota archaeon]